MLRRLTFSLLATVAFAVSFNLFSATGRAQQKTEAEAWYRLAYATLEGFRRDGFDYGPNKNRAIDAVRSQCSDCAKRINMAMYQAVSQKQRACHANPRCEVETEREYQRIAKDIYAGLKAACALKESAVESYYRNGGAAGMGRARRRKDETPSYDGRVDEETLSWKHAEPRRVDEETLSMKSAQRPCGRTVANENSAYYAERTANHRTLNREHDLHAQIMATNPSEKENKRHKARVRQIEQQSVELEERHQRCILKITAPKPLGR